MELNFLISVLDRDRADDMTTIYKDHGLPMIVTFLGRGTATGEVLDLYGLQATEKAVVTSVADAEKPARSCAARNANYLSTFPATAS